MYHTDLTETEWQYITKVLNLQERKRKYYLRSTAFSLKKSCSSLFVAVKALIFAHSDAEAPPYVLLLIVHFNFFIGGIQ